MFERYMPDGFGADQWANQTNINTYETLLILLCGIAIMLVKRHHAILFVMIVACFIASSQRLVIFGMDFSAIRIILLFGISRVFIYSEYKDLQAHPLDYIYVLYFASRTLLHTIQTGSTSTLVYELGNNYELLGFYFLFRVLIRNWLDLRECTLSLALLSLPVAAIFTYEHFWLDNIFWLNSEANSDLLFRMGIVRAYGAFSHPIIAGCFWATLLPLFIAFYRADREPSHRVFYTLGFISSCWIIFTTGSSTPILSALVAILGSAVMFIRPYMNILRWGGLISLISLHMVMQAPVWHLISRISVVPGSTAYFRYQIIDSAIVHFSEWWKVGTSYTGHWFWGAQDLTNHLVRIGVEAGFLSFLLFLAVIVIGFVSIGAVMAHSIANRDASIISWSIGVVLLVHFANFFGVSYFGQIAILLPLTLAIIVNLHQFTSQNQPAQTTAPEEA